MSVIGEVIPLCRGFLTRCYVMFFHGFIGVLRDVEWDA